MIDPKVIKQDFDAVLKRMIATKPTPHKDMPSQSKAKKRSKKNVQKSDKRT
jgi:hypothetical protein